MKTTQWLSDFGALLSRVTPKRLRAKPRHTPGVVERMEPRLYMSATPNGNEFLINATTSATQKLWEESTIASAPLPGGGFVTTWTSDNQDGDGNGVFARRFGADGQPVGSEFLVNSTTTHAQQRSSVAASADGSFVITWEALGNQDGDNTGVYAQRYNASGQAQGGEFRVNVTTTGDQDNPTVTYLANSNFVVIWQGKGSGDNLGVYGRIYNAGGTALTGELQINTHIDNQQQYAAIAATPNGGFVVGWESRGSQDGDASGIYLQLFDSSGSMVGGEILANTTTQGMQILPSIAVGSDGKFVVAWQSSVQDGSGGGVYAQRFNANGTKSGGEFRVNVTTVNDQVNPSVAINGHGGFVIVWNGKGADDPNGVYLREYDASGTALTGEVPVNNTTDQPQQNPVVIVASSGYAVVWNGKGSEDNEGIFGRRFGSGPTSAGIATINVNEDAADTVVSLWNVFEDSESADSQLTYAVHGNTNASLFSSVSIDAATGRLRLSYAANANGSSTVTIRVSDAGGLYVDTSFQVVVAAINDTPMTSGLSNISVSEDSSNTVINLASAFSDIEDSTLSYSIHGNTNIGLFGNVTINNSSKQLTLQYGANAHGSATITVRATDSGGAYVDSNFSVMVQSVNDAPTSSEIAAVNVNEDASPTQVNLSSAFSDVEDVTLVYTIVSNSNSALFSSTALNSHQLTLAYVAQAYGAAQIVVRATDSSGASVESTLNVTVHSVNDAPLTTGLDDVQVTKNSPATALYLPAYFSDLDDATEDLAFTVTNNSNPALFALISVVDGQLILEYAADTIGVSHLTVSAADPGGLIVTASFNVSVEAVDHPPGTLGIPNIQVDQNSPATYLNLWQLFSDPEDPAPTLQYTLVSNSAPTIVDAVIDIDTGQLKISYLPNAYGNAQIVVRATDSSGLSVDATAVIAVDRVKLAPTIQTLQVAPEPSISGGRLRIRALAVNDDMGISHVKFYRDLNGDGLLGPEDGQPVATDSDGSDGWQTDLSTAGMSGQQRFFAQATDNDGLNSSVISAIDNLGMVAVLDSSQPGYTETGAGWAEGAVGVAGNSREHAASANGETATWQFDDLPAGPYVVYVAWVPDSGRESAAQFTVRDGSAVENTSSIDQRVAPADLFDGQTWWRKLGNFAITSGTLAVDLAAGANGSVSADAVRVIDAQPIVESLSINNGAMRGLSVTLTAAVSNAAGIENVSEVRFYRSSDGTFHPDAGHLIGTSNLASNWALTVNTAAWAAGSYMLYAQAVDAVGNAGPAKVVALAEPQAGVVYRRYTGNWSSLPNWDALQPAGVALYNNFTIPAGVPATQFGVVYTSYLQVPADGTYTLYLKSDDGSRISIDGNVVVNHDGNHGFTEKSATVTLTAGMHPVKLEYFQQGGGANLQVQWTFPGSTVRQNMDAYLFRATDTKAPSAPANPSVNAVSTTRVDVSWMASTDDVAVAGYNVYRSGVLLNTAGLITGTTFSDTTVTAQSSYAYTVEAVDLAANHSTMATTPAVTTPRSGIYYTTYDGSFSIVPTMPGNLTPLSSGTATTISLQSGWPTTRFAAQFQGFLSVPTAGTYTLYINSNDGSNLYINGNKLISNDGLHGAIEKSATITFSSPGQYPIRIDYFQDVASLALSASWAGPGFSKTAIPASALCLPADAGAPNAPTNLTATGSASWAAVSWTAATDDVGVISYDVYRDGTYVGTTANTTFRDTTNIAPASSYSYHVTARDQAGNVSAASGAVSVTTPNVPLGVFYQYYEGSWSNLPNFDQLPVKGQGASPTFDITQFATPSRFGVRFTGYIDVPADGTYTFYTTSDDGSRLYIKDQVSPIIVNNDGSHAMASVSGQVYLTAGLHPIVVDYFQGTGGKGLLVEWAGPNFARRAISNASLVSALAPNTYAATVLVAAPSAMIAGGTATITATVFGAPATNMGINFYRDNGDGVLNVTTDSLIGAGTRAGDTWSITTSTATWTIGMNRVFAQVIDNGNAVGAGVAVIALTSDLAVIDNGDPGYSDGSLWTSSTFQLASAFGGDYRTAYGTGTAGPATWTFNSLPDGTYAIYSTYVPSGSNTSAAVFSAYNGAPDSTPDSVRTISQTSLISDYTYNGQDWRMVGAVTVTNGTVTVQLASGNNAWAVADAVALRRMVTGEMLLNVPPVVVRSLSPDFTVEAKVVDPTGTAVSSVDFYVDTNGSGVIDAGDAFLGAGTKSGNVWSVNANSDSLPLGENVILAKSTKTDGTTFLASIKMTVSPLALTWPGGSGTWNTTSPIWRTPDGQLHTWIDGATAIFSGVPGTITLDGMFNLAKMQFKNDGFVLTGSGQINTATNPLTIEVSAGFTATIKTPISGTGGLLKIGTGSLRLAAANTLTGIIEINGGRLRTDVDNALPASAIIQIGNPNYGSGILDLNGHNLRVAGLSSGMSGGLNNIYKDTVTNTSTTHAQLTVDNSEYFVYNGVFTGPLSISKYGTGKWTLGGINTNTGDVLVYDGNFKVLGSFVVQPRIITGFGNPQITSIDDPYFQAVNVSIRKGYGAWTSVGDMIAENPSVLATDWMDAAIKALRGHIEVNAAEQTHDPFDFPKVDGSDNFIKITPGMTRPENSLTDPYFKPFLIGTLGDIKAWVTYNGYSPFHMKENDAGLHGWDTKVIVLEDLHKLRQNDFDYDDSYWVVDIGLPVSIQATDGYARETPSSDSRDPKDSGEFTISRGEGNVQGTLRVKYEFALAADVGNNVVLATDGTDYSEELIMTNESDGKKTGYVDIPDGKSSVTLRITPEHDNVKEWDERVQLKIISVEDVTPPESGHTPVSYVVDANKNSAFVTIFDNNSDIGGMVNRNIDVATTGNVEQSVGSGPLSVDVQRGSVILSGALQFDAFSPIYMANDDIRPIISIEMELPAVPNGNISATLSIGGAGSTYQVTTSFTNYSVINNAGTKAQFVIVGPKQLEDYLRTGHYDWDVAFTVPTSSGSRVRTIRGGTELVNRLNEDFGDAFLGARWWINGLDGLYAADGVSSKSNGTSTADDTTRLVDKGLAARPGFTIVRGDGSSAWFGSVPNPSSITYVDGFGYGYGYGYGGNGIGFGPYPLAPQSSGWMAGSGTVTFDNETQSAGYQGNYHIALSDGTGYDGEPVDKTVSASWTTTGLRGGRLYQVFTTWVPTAEAADLVKYTVSATKGELTPLFGSKEVTYIDQRYSPGENIITGSPVRWRSLGWFALGGGYGYASDIKVTLDATVSANESVSADGIMVASNWEFSTTVDGSFNSSSLVYNQSADRDDTFTITDKNGTKSVFDIFGRLLNKTDYNNNQTKFDWEDEVGNSATELTRITTQGNRQWEFEYESDKITQKDYAGREVVYTLSADLGYGYGPRHQVMKIEFPDPDGEEGDQSKPTIDFTYYDLGGSNEAGQVKTIKTAGIQTATGVVRPETTLEYSATSGRFKKATNADTTTWQLTPALLSHPDAIAATPATSVKAIYTNERNKQWHYTVDNYGLVTSMTDPLGVATTGDADDFIWKYERDKNGLVKKLTEPKGAGGMANLGALVTDYEYDSAGNLKKVTYPQSKHGGGGAKITEEWEYYPVGSEGYNQLKKYTNPRGYVTDYVLTDDKLNVKEIRQQVDSSSSSDDYDDDKADPTKWITTKFEYNAQPTDISSMPGGLVVLATEAFGSPDESKTKSEYFDSGNQIGLLKKETLAYTSNVETATYYTYDDYCNPLIVTNDPTVAGQEGDPLDDLERTIRYEYDALNRLVKETGLATDDHDEPVTEYAYDPEGDLTQVKNAAGDSTDFIYNKMGRLERTKFPAPAGNTESDQTQPETVNLYDPAGNLEMEAILRSAGSYRVTSHEYNDRNERIKTYTDSPDYTSGDTGWSWYSGQVTSNGQSATPTIVYAYDSAGNLKSETDARYGAASSTNVKTLYEYDSLHRVTKVTSPTPHQASGAPVALYEYFDDDLLAKVTSPSPGPSSTAIVQYQYDGLGQLTRQINPNDGQTSSTQLTIDYSYDGRGNIKQMIEHGGGKSRTTTTYFDMLNRVIAEDGPDADGSHPGISVYYAYNAAMDMVAQLVFAGNVVSGDVSDGQITEAEIDARMSAVWSGGGTNNIAQKTSTEYDKLGRVKVVNAPDPSRGTISNAHVKTEYVYDILGNMLQQKVTSYNPNVVLTTDWVYDKLSRVWKALSPETPDDGRPETRIAYNVDGTAKFQKVKNTIDSDGWLITEYGYDKLGRVSSIIQEDPANTTNGKMTTKLYRDALGNVLLAVDGFGLQTRAEFDDAGLNRSTVQQRALTTLLTPSGPVPHTDVFFGSYYVYNTAGMVRNVQQGEKSDNSTTPNFYGSGTTYVYDNLGRVTKETQDLNPEGPDDAVTTFAYDVFGGRTSVKTPKNDETVFTVDALGRVTQESISTPALTRSFHYDSFGNVLTATNRNNKTIDYTYDNLGRLKKEDWASSSYEANYDYTALGELKTASNPSSNYVYEYDDARRLSEVTQTLHPWAGETDDIQFTYEHDFQGNITKATGNLDGGTKDYRNTYAYDSLGRMKSVTQVPVGGISHVSNKHVTYQYEYVLSGGHPFIHTVVKRYAASTAASASLQASTIINASPNGEVNGLFHFLGDIYSGAIEDNPPSNLIASYKKGRDARGLIVNQEIRSYGTNQPNNFSRSYEEFIYNNYGQTEKIVTYATNYANPTGHTFTQNLAYDLNGNPLGSDNLVGALDRLLASTDNMYVYDNEGNRTEDWRFGSRVTGSTIAFGSEAIHTGTQPWDSGYYRIEFNNLVFSEFTTGENVGVEIKIGDTSVGTFTLTSFTPSGSHMIANWPDSVMVRLPSAVTSGQLRIEFSTSGTDPSIVAGSNFTVQRLESVQFYQWDHRNRLIHVTVKHADGSTSGVEHAAPVGSSLGVIKLQANAHSASTYVYDVHDQLIGRKFDDESAGDKYVYDRGQVVSRTETVAYAPYTMVDVRLWGPGVDNLIADDSGNGWATLWTLPDEQGTIRNTVRESNRYSLEFDQHNIPLTTASAPPDMFLETYYAGREYDFITLMNNNRARWYDLRSGRFISEDPMGYEGGDTNLYRYAYNSHQNATDPSGRIVFIPFLIVAGIYLLKNAAVAVIETSVESGVANYMGDESFSWGSTFLRNFGINAAIGWIPGAAEGKAAVKIAAIGAKYGGKYGARAAKYAFHYGTEVAVGTVGDTAWEVGVNGRKFGDAFSESLAGNLIGQGFGDTLSAGLRPLARGAAHAAGPLAQRMRLCFEAGTVVEMASASVDAPQFQAIETIRPGQRVAVSNPSTTPDVKDWQLIRLKPVEGNDSAAEITLLRPESWRGERGRGDAIMLDVLELGLKGRAVIIGIEPCPPIEAGDAPLVTGTFRHTASNIVEVKVEGLDEPIRCTPAHPFWSVTRNDFVAAKELQVGEELLTRMGKPVSVQGITPKLAATVVYNIEVAGVHEYRASSLGIRVHNASSAPDPGSRRAYLNAKFGRSGDLNADINMRGIDDAIRVNATRAVHFTRMDITRSANGFGTRAHRYFERFNNRLSNRVAGTYRVATEQFRNAHGQVVARRARGSIGVDVIYVPWSGGVRPTIFDLKTFTVAGTPISAARQINFLRRFTAFADEIYRNQW